MPSIVGTWRLVRAVARDGSGATLARALWRQGHRPGHVYRGRTDAVDGVRRPHDDKTGYRGLTDPSINPDQDQSHHDLQNRIATIFAGAHVKPNFAKPGGITHVNILRTIEAIYGLPKSGAQQPNALRAGISDDATVADVFAPVQ